MDSNPKFWVKKVQLAEVDPSKKYFVMVKVDNDFWLNEEQSLSVGNDIMTAMQRLGCPRENVSVMFGYGLELSIVQAENQENTDVSAD